MRAMTLEQLRRKVTGTGAPDVSKLSGVPLRTVYRFIATGIAPKYATILKLQKWAKR